MTSGTPAEADALEANRAFYAAFEAGDLGGVSAVWDHGDGVVCTHPGWATVHGWREVRDSFAAILRGGPPGQFIVTNESVVVHGDAAWVTCDENLWAAGGAVTIAALNVLVRDDGGGRWRMVAHHGSAVHGHVPADDGGAASTG